MRKLWLPFILVAAAVAVAQVPRKEHPISIDDRPRPVHSYVRETVVRTARGPVAVRAEVSQWIISGYTRVPKLPLPEGATVVGQVRGGELTTIIDGERRERREGEYFTVPPGKTLGVETEDDSAVLETIAIVPGRG